MQAQLTFEEAIVHSPIIYLTEDYDRLYELSAKDESGCLDADELFKDYNWTLDECFLNIDDAGGAALALPKSHKLVFQELLDISRKLTHLFRQDDQHEMEKFLKEVGPDRFTFNLLVALHEFTEAGFAMENLPEINSLRLSITRHDWFAFKKRKLSVVRDYYATASRLLSEGVLLPDQINPFNNSFSYEDRTFLTRYLKRSEDRRCVFVELNPDEATYLYGGRMDEYMDSLIPLLQEEDEVVRYLICDFTGIYDA